MTKPQHALQENIVKITNTVDVNGHLLVAGQTYLYKGKPIRVLRELYGPGNSKLTYHRVYFTDEMLEEQSIAVDEQYHGGVYGSTTYKAFFTPVEQ